MPSPRSTYILPEPLNVYFNLPVLFFISLSSVITRRGSNSYGVACASLFSECPARITARAFHPS